MEVIDDFLDEELLEDLVYNFLHTYPHYYIGHSHKNSKLFYYYNFYDINQNKLSQISPIGKTLINKLSRFTKEIILTKLYLNIQHPGMCGEPHIDYTPDTKGKTFLIMITKKDIGGEFMYKKNETFESIEYKQNRLIIFDGSIPHYGKDFKNTPRITLAFKFKKI